MLVNISYNDPELKLRIESAVGKPFSIKKRWDLGGIGSPKLFISSCSIDIRNLLILDQNINQCNIELRPQGIIIRFRSLLETYGLVIPYYKLKVYKGKAEEYSLYKDHSFIKVKANSKVIHDFFKKIRAQKALNTPSSLDEL
ncbi:MAG: hypothetical protein ACPIAA_00035 [Flavobacteriaceae bacterium]